MMTSRRGLRDQGEEMGVRGKEIQFKFQYATIVKVKAEEKVRRVSEAPSTEVLQNVPSA